MPNSPQRLLARSRPISSLRRFLDNEAAGGLMLIAAAALALLVANSPWATRYSAALSAYVGPMSISHWINDGLMAVFFLLVGLEIKREMLDGQLSSSSNRMLPGIAALGGMVMPAIIYIAFNAGSPETLRGWAIPTATDIAFALGVLSLLGPRVPTSLKVFLAALAIIDDLGAVIIIAVFYTSQLSAFDLATAAVTLTALAIVGRLRVIAIWPYLVLGLILWFFVHRSGVHATIAGVLLALTIPLRATPGAPDEPARSPLHVLEHALHRPVAFLIIPLFGFANAGVSLGGVGLASLTEPLTLGVALGLLCGKVLGVFGSVGLMIRLGFATMPFRATWLHLLGTALLCGVGFTMSLFIGLLAFADTPHLQEAVKIGILCGSFVSGVLGYMVLRAAPRPTEVRRHPVTPIAP